MTNFQLGNLIPSMRSTIISLHCGAYDSSAFVLVLVKVRTTNQLLKSVLEHIYTREGVLHQMFGKGGSACCKN